MCDHVRAGGREGPGMIGAILKAAAIFMAGALVLFALLMAMGYLDFWVAEVFG